LFDGNALKIIKQNSVFVESWWLRNTNQMNLA